MIEKTKPAIVKAVDDEKWRNSSLYPEIMVSSKGRVKERGYQKVIKDKEEGCFRIYEVASKMLSPSVGASGDVTVSFRSNGIWTCERVDFLVATEFLSNADPAHFSKVRHKDNNKANLNLANLEWVGSGIWNR